MSMTPDIRPYDPLTGKLEPREDRNVMDDWNTTTPMRKREDTGGWIMVAMFFGSPLLLVLLGLANELLKWWLE